MKLGRIAVKCALHWRRPGFNFRPGSTVLSVIFSGTFLGPFKRKEINGYNASKPSYKMTFLYIMGPGIP